MRRAGSNAAGNGGGPAEPTAHASTHLAGGTDPIAAATTSALGLAQLSADGGTTAGRVVQATDPRLAAASTSNRGTVQLGGVAGQFLESVGPGVGFSVPALRPWTAWETDFTAQGNASFSSDTTYVVDGKTWTAHNTAAAGTFGLQSGTGLVITASSGVSRTWTTTRTAPALTIPLASLESTLVSCMAPVTLWFSLAAWTAAVTANALILGVWAPSGSYTELVAAAGVINDSGTTRPFAQRTATFTANTAQASTPTCTIAVRVLPGGIVDSWMGAAYSGGAWPALNAMTQIASDTQPGAAAIATLAQVLRSGSSLVVAAATRTASASTPSLTLARSRVTVG